jgi:programmed cell death protein 5
MITEEELIKKRLIERQAALTNAQIQAAAQSAVLQEQLAILKRITSTIMEPAARERLANIKLVKPDLALQLEVYLVQLYQTGQLRQKITESQLIAMLEKLSGRQEFKIKRK